VEVIEVTSTTEQERQMGTRAVSIISLLAGIWLFLSPWVYGVSTSPNAWNSWIVGAVIAIVAAIRVSAPGTSGLSWINCLLGIWTFASPWIYGYAGAEARFINSLCIGVIVFFAALKSATTTPHAQHPAVTRS
jgi:SPW repeat